jgi:uncharacterized integral membrane protein
MTTITTILSFMILVLLLAFGVQNSAAVQMKFALWSFQMSIHMVVFWAAVGGAAMITLLVLPKLGIKYMQTRRLQREVQRLEKLGPEPAAAERKS